MIYIKIFIKILIIVFIIILITSLFFLIKDFLEYRESSDINTELIENVITNDITKEEFIINWNELKSANKDIIAWIRIKNTNINYPILKDNDSLKYLNRSYTGKYNKNGSIFTLNANPFIDNVTIIHGHNMKSGLMFSDLSKYMNKNFFNENNTIEIYTEKQNYIGTIFSCYSIGIETEERNIKSLSFNEEIQYYKNMSVHNTDNIENIEKVIKLSTCSYINNHSSPTNQRYFIVANLKKF